jgi:phosphohistidine phosphatase
MKTLYLARHAKSSWDDPNVEDVDRPLKTNGVQDAYFMGAHLKSKGVSPQAIITSHAARALNTAIIFASQLQFPVEQIKIFRKIYESSPAEIMEAISSIDNQTESIMVFGHDPSLTKLVLMLTGKEPEKIPTSAVAAIELDIVNWNELSGASGNLAFLEKPKEVKALLSRG